LGGFASEARFACKSCPTEFTNPTRYEIDREGALKLNRPRQFI